MVVFESYVFCLNQNVFLSFLSVMLLLLGEFHDLLDSWGPLKALAVASVLNGIGDVILCLFVGYGIAGAAWATMASRVVSGFMMVEALKDKGYNGYAVAVLSANELLQIFKLAAPIFIMMMSKGRAFIANRTIVYARTLTFI
ncbi:hypothetical protein Hanom_Chr14g01301611 [Helianthus anomalus]